MAHLLTLTSPRGSPILLLENIFLLNPVESLNVLQGPSSTPDQLNGKLFQRNMDIGVSFLLRTSQEIPLSSESGDHRLTGALLPSAEIWLLLRGLGESEPSSCPPSG